jgi:hypothetical protein
MTDYGLPDTSKSAEVSAAATPPKVSGGVGSGLVESEVQPAASGAPLGATKEAMVKGLKQRLFTKGIPRTTVLPLIIL